ncbi:rod shape-determining protein MreC [Herpetosiphon sp. NSE202]|uniref:rod shape-determining protein MreC n=1 Tax=Herpetosiphon sp. NSE202 TaxID=3351349 RepID=UPI0036457E7E
MSNRSGNAQRATKLIIWLACIVVVLLLLDQQGILNPVTASTARFLTPVTRTLTNIRLAISDTFGGIFGSSQAAQDLAAMQQRVTELENENLQLRSAAAENATLRRTAGMRERYGWRTVIGNVVSRSADAGNRLISIDRGSADGLAVGMPVVSHVNGSPDALIGLVDTVSQHNATVLLITDSRSVISGQVLAQVANEQEGGSISQPMGDVLGQWQLGSRLIMRHIDRDAKFNVGDDVLTAGISKALAFDAPAARIPPDVPIGRVSAIRPDGHGQQADIEPYFDPDVVRTVWIIVGED